MRTPPAALLPRARRLRAGSARRRARDAAPARLASSMQAASSSQGPPRAASIGCQGKIAAAPAEPAAGLGESGGKHVGQRRRRAPAAAARAARRTRCPRRAPCRGARRASRAATSAAARRAVRRGHRRQIVGLFASSRPPRSTPPRRLRSRNCGSTRSRSSSTSAGWRNADSMRRRARRSCSQL